MVVSKPPLTKDTGELAKSPAGLPDRWRVGGCSPPLVTGSYSLWGSCFCTTDLSFTKASATTGSARERECELPRPLLSWVPVPESKSAALIGRVKATYFTLGAREEAAGDLRIQQIQQLVLLDLSQDRRSGAFIPQTYKRVKIHLFYVTDVRYRQ